VVRRADVEIGLARGQRRLVQQHLLAVVASARPPGVDRVLGPGVIADVVVPRPVRGGDRGVVLLDATPHLGEQLRLQRLGARQHRLGVGVLGLQVRPDVGAQRLRVAQHLLPVVVLHPGIVVDAHAAQLLDPLRALLGGRGVGQAHGRPDAPRAGRAQAGANLTRGETPRCGDFVSAWRPVPNLIHSLAIEIAHKSREGFGRFSAGAAMVMDLAVELIHATVQLEQPLGDGTRTVGTGFLISAPSADGKPRTILVTANHVLQKMPGGTARIGYRVGNADGSWTYTPQPLKIRDKQGQELWTHHPNRDVAAIAITAPPEFAKAAIPINYLASDESFAQYRVGAGDEMMALGFPRGLSANAAGFPILRSGRVASYPIAPAKVFPTFLLDFAVFAGNSGGPVFMPRAPQPHQGLTPASNAAPAPTEGFIAGLLTQQVELNSERLEIGIVTHAKFIRETIALLGNPLADTTVAESVPTAGSRAANAEEAARN
jgi:S1-C subfamily serine protease